MNPLPLRSILAATNLSEEAELALRAAQALRPEGTRLHVVHCHTGGRHELAEPTRSSGTPDMDEATRDESDVHSTFIRHVTEAGLELSDIAVHLRTGAPHREVRALAEEVEADLIVLGSHRPRRMFDGLLGTTADRVIRTARRPSLVVNREVASRPRRILVASDLSPVADRALDVAVSWARHWASGDGRDESRKVRIELLHIFDFARPGYMAGATKAEALSERASRAGEEAGPQVTVRPRTLSAPLAADGILRAAEESDPDLVFLGTHGHGFFLRALLGGVASEVVRTMRFPIVVVPPEAEGTNAGAP